MSVSPGGGSNIQTVRALFPARYYASCPPAPSGLVSRTRCPRSTCTATSQNSRVSHNSRTMDTLDQLSRITLGLIGKFLPYRNLTSKP